MTFFFYKNAKKPTHEGIVVEPVDKHKQIKEGEERLQESGVSGSRGGRR